MKKKKTISPVLRVLVIAAVIITVASFAFAKIAGPVYSNDGISFLPFRNQVNQKKSTVSIFSWEPIFLNADLLPEITGSFSDLGITRVYEEFPLDTERYEDIGKMANALHYRGIEIFYLTGDRNWFIDGYSELYDIIDQLSDYNDFCADHCKRVIDGIALDIEAFTLDEWKNDPQDAFGKFVSDMKSVMDYALRHEIRVVQIIPVSLYETDSELFEEFVDCCCDELSVMNYEKRTAVSAIHNELDVARRLRKPCETIFETMPENEKYGVTDQNTYWNDGYGKLLSSVENMKEQYGNSLGISFHHIVTLYHLKTGRYLVNIYPYASDKYPLKKASGQPDDLYLIEMTDECGEKIRAYTYYMYGKSEYDEYTALAVGILENTEYSVRFYDREMNEIGEASKYIFDASGSGSHKSDSIKVKPIQ